MHGPQNIKFHFSSENFHISSKASQRDWKPKRRIPKKKKNIDYTFL